METLPYPEQESAAVEAMMRAARLFNAVLAASLARTGAQVTPPQLRVLVLLAHRPEVGTADIATALGVDPSSATRLCDRLAAAGLIERRQSTRDRRRVRMTLTDAGSRLVGAVLDHRRAVFATMVHALVPEDREVLVRALDALINSADAVWLERLADPC